MTFSCNQQPRRRGWECGRRDLHLMRMPMPPFTRKSASIYLLVTGLVLLCVVFLGYALYHAKPHSEPQLPLEHTLHSPHPMPAK